MEVYRESNTKDFCVAAVDITAKGANVAVFVAFSDDDLRKEILRMETELLDRKLGRYKCVLSAGTAGAQGSNDASPAYMRLGVSVGTDGNVTIRTIQSEKALTLEPSDVPLLIAALHSLHQIGSGRELISLDPSL